MHSSQISMVLNSIVVCNMTAPRTRRDGVIDHLAPICTGLVITAFVFSFIWLFAYPTFMRFPDLENPDFYPIFIILQSWFGVVIFAFLALGSPHFRKAMLTQVQINCGIN